jgi:hypothetical protein
MHGTRPAAGEGGRREARGHVGRSRKKMGWAKPGRTGKFVIYSNEFQTSSKCFDQKVDLPSFKNFK